MFQLTDHGLELIEVAPGIDIERDILAHMAFKPHIHKPIPMNPALFRDEPMDLLSDLLNQKLTERATYDAKNNVLSIDLSGWSVRKKADITDLQKVIVETCEAAGRRVNVVVNQNGCRIAEDLYEDYANMVAYLKKNYYARMARYATSDITRQKLQEALRRRGLQTQIFERADEANASLEQQPAE